MRAVLVVLGVLLVLGFVALADDGSVVWPGASSRSLDEPCALLETYVSEFLSDDSFVYYCRFIGCTCVSNLQACCREQCCHWTCSLDPRSITCDCYYRITCYWVPNCYTKPELPMRIEPIGGEQCELQRFYIGLY